MKRKSILILIAALVLAVSIPVFGLAQSNVAVQPLDGTGNMRGRSNTQTAEQGDRLMLMDCDGECDGDCVPQGTGLGADGVVQRKNARTESGQRMLLKNGDNELCENCENCENAVPEYQNRRDLSTGGRGRHQVN